MIIILWAAACLSIVASPFSEPAAADNAALPDNTGRDTAVSDTVRSLDSVAIDTVAYDSTTDSTLADTLRAGKKPTEEIRPLGKNCVGVNFTFLIPIINELKALRSDDENREMNDHMIKDAEERFEENDICFPLGLSYRRQLGEWIEIRGTSSFFWIKNSAMWTPPEDDSLFTKDHWHTYEFRVVQLCLETQFTVSPGLITVDRFSRLYVGFMGEILPYLRFRTERTELDKKINSRGMGWGAAVWAGVERYLNESSSFTGAVGYSLGQWGDFKDGDAVKRSDVRKYGDDGDYQINVRSLRFQFAYWRWF